MLFPVLSVPYRFHCPLLVNVQIVAYFMLYSTGSSFVSSLCWSGDILHNLTLYAVYIQSFVLAWGSTMSEKQKFRTGAAMCSPGLAQWNSWRIWSIWFVRVLAYSGLLTHVIWPLVTLKIATAFDADLMNSGESIHHAAFWPANLLKIFIWIHTGVVSHRKCWNYVVVLIAIGGSRFFTGSLSSNNGLAYAQSRTHWCKNLVLECLGRHWDNGVNCSKV
jgi:hypothetical protein